MRGSHKRTHAREMYSRVLQIPNTRRTMISLSLSLSLLSLPLSRTLIYNGVHLHELHNNSRRCIDEPYIGQGASRLRVFTQY